MGGVMEREYNLFLFIGSGAVAWFYSSINFLGIKDIQVFALLIIFIISMVAGFLKTLALKEEVRSFVCSDLLSKTLMLFIPFVFAIEAKMLEVFKFFVDYSFAFLTLGEILAIMISIQSIKTRTPIKELDIYNMGIKKLQDFIIRHLKFEGKFKEKEERDEKQESHHNSARR